MKKHLIFFDQTGLTNASASATADKAKAAIAILEGKLNKINLVSEGYSLLDKVTTTPLSYGISEEDLDKIKDQLGKIAKYKSLIAWLREAIKAREKLINEVRELDVTSWAKDNNIEYPDYVHREIYPTASDYIANQSIHDRNKYYELETYCAVVGKFIHPGGSFDKARENYIDRISTPSEIDTIGTSTIVRHYIPSVPEEKVNSIYNELNDLHRDSQSQLNKMKHDCEQWVNAEIARIDNEYEVKYDEYVQKVQIINEKFSNWKKSEILRLSKLKIKIPNNLLDIYNEVQNL